MQIKRFTSPTAIILIVIFISGVIIYLSSEWALKGIGAFLVRDETPVHSDAVVVLSTGMAYYPRLIEAAELYNRGIVRTIVVNGNRKTDVLRELEAKGLEPCCGWCEGTLRILALFNVPREKVICVSAEDIYDTVSEATLVGNELIQRGFKDIIVTTSKSHTKRAGYIWESIFKDRLSVVLVSAKTDPYNPSGWWKTGRQVRWVLAEYGAWLYFWWKDFKKPDSA